MKLNDTQNNRDYFLYCTILGSGLFTACYYETDIFAFRLGAFICIILFYADTFRYLFNYTSLNKYYSKQNTLLKVCLLVCIVVLSYSLDFGTKNLTTLFFHPYSFLAFFICIVAFRVNSTTIINLLNLSRRVNTLIPIVLGGDFLLFNKPVMINDLSFFILFELLFIDRLTAKRKMYLLLLTISVIYVENSFDNRTIAVRILMVLLMFLSFYYFRYLQQKIVKLLMLMLAIVILYFIVTSFEDTFNYVMSILSSKSINKTDTRSFLFYEFFESFKKSDWVFGRGYLGTYFSQYFLDWQGIGGDSSNRFTVEVGILDILLKGGLILLVPFIAIVLMALKWGFIEQKFNTVSFRCSILLFAEFLLMGIENFPSFSVHFMIIWLLIGIIINNNTNKIKNIYGNR